MAIEFKRLTNGTITIKDTVTGRTKRKVDKGGVKNISTDIAGNVLFGNDVSFTLFSIPLADITTIDNVAAPSNADDKINALSELFNNIPVTVSGGSGGSIDTTGLAKDNTLSAVNDKVASIDGKTPALQGGLVPIKLDQTGLAKSTDLSPLAKSTDITPLAKSTDITPLAKSTDITPLAKSTDLTPLAKSTDFALLATDGKLDTIIDRLDNLSDTVIAQATANGTSNDIVDTLEDLLPLVGGDSTAAPTDYSTETTLAALSAKILPKGQATKANSAPVTLPSDIDSLPTFTKPDLAVGGYRRFHQKVAIAGNNNTTIQGGATALNWIKAENFATTTRYIKIYNQSGPTIGTTVPVMRFSIPPSTTVNSVVVPGKLSETFSQGTLGTALAYSFDTSIADSSTGSGVAAGDIYMTINSAY